MCCGMAILSPLLVTELIGGHALVKLFSLMRRGRAILSRLLVSELNGGHALLQLLQLSSQYVGAYHH